jgi:hypothetical protein
MNAVVTQEERAEYALQMNWLESSKVSGHDIEMVVSQLDGMNPGFRDYLKRWTDAERRRIEDIDAGPIVTGDPESRPQWYTGPLQDHGEWSRYREVLEEKFGAGAEIVTTVDESTDVILNEVANPLKEGEKRKGLVVGYVQSGKTANYAGVIAKAIDARYRIIIVLSGIHSNLRQQTQVRLESDLRIEDSLRHGRLAYSKLTGEQTASGQDMDIPDSRSAGSVLSNPDIVVFMVVKKNSARLRRVAEFLQGIPESRRAERPVLLIDDESDQATPNSASGRDRISAINKRVRDIWDEVVTGTYIGYTATPFANIFINPRDAKDLYPEDFCYALPRPSDYMGASTFFDLEKQDEADGDDSEQMISRLSIQLDEAESAVLVPKGRDLSNYAPTMTPGLRESIAWFLLATAVRRIRAGRSQHSSMLVHTSHRVPAHDALKAVVEEHLRELRETLPDCEGQFRALFEREIDRAEDLRKGENVPEWKEIWNRIDDVLAATAVKVDNGQSTDRLSYPDDEPQTIIAIGGGTLSRGLTLEGLICSFFLRTSNTYDTLLQMGRWFGFRPGYADLARVWVGMGLLEEYAFLAAVEDELREEIGQMREEQKTPKHLGVRVRTHPGRLQVTSPDKMKAARVLTPSLGGEKYQVTYLDKSEKGIARSQRAAGDLVARLSSRGAPLELPESGSDGPRLFRDVSGAEVITYLRDAWIPDVYPWLQPDLVERWMSGAGEGTSWNVLLASPQSSRGDITLYEYAPGLTIRSTLRTPNTAWSEHRYGGKTPEGSQLTNIRALLTGGDATADIDFLARAKLLDDEASKHLAEFKKRAEAETQSRRSVKERKLRRDVLPGTGLLILYAIDRNSAARIDDEAKREERATADEVILPGFIFPSLLSGDDDREYLGVDPAADILYSGDDVDDLPEDDDTTAETDEGERA